MDYIPVRYFLQLHAVFHAAAWPALTCSRNEYNSCRQISNTIISIKVGDEQIPQEPGLLKPNNQLQCDKVYRGARQ